MAPQIRRLEVAGADTVVLTAGVVERLTGRYTVDIGRGTTVTRIPLETFDRRLVAAGLALHLQEFAGEAALVLRRDDGSEVTSAATGFTAPAVADRLPPGAVRDIVAGPMKLRAVIAGPPKRRRVQLLTVRDKNSKAVVRIELDAPAGSGATDALGGTVLTVSPVKGYERDGTRVLGLLSRLPGVAPVAAPDPEPAIKPPAALIERSTPAPQAVADVVSGYLAEMCANIPGLIDDIDTEFLHDYRVAVRRTRSTLKLSRPVLDPATVRHWEAEGKRLGDLTTPLRDLDVHLLGLPTMRGWLVSADPADLAPFEAHLRRRRATAHRELVRALGTRRSQEFLTDWTGELVETAGELSRITADELSRGCISRAHRRVVKLGSAIKADSPHEGLHTLRKRCKELRYALEMFTALHDPTTTGKAIADLKRLQDCLGRFQDAEVQQHAVRTFADEMAAGSAPASALLAMGELVTHLETDQAAARTDLGDAFARFVRPSSTARLQALGTEGSR